MTTTQPAVSGTGANLPLPGGAPPSRGGNRFRLQVTGTVGPLGIGVSMLWLSVIVLLPLAALTVTSFENGWSGFWDAVTAPAAVETRVSHSTRSSSWMRQAGWCRPSTIARATGDGSVPSTTKPRATCTLGVATIRGSVPRCGQVAVWMRNG